MRHGSSIMLGALAACLVLSLAGCSALPVIPFFPLPPTPTPTEPPALPTELHAYEPGEGEVAVGSVSTQTGVKTLGPFPVEGERIAVYVDSSAWAR